MALHNDYYRCYQVCATCRWRGKDRCGKTHEYVDPVLGKRRRLMAEGPLDMVAAQQCRGHWWDPDRRHVLKANVVEFLQSILLDVDALACLLLFMGPVLLVITAVLVDQGCTETEKPPTMEQLESQVRKLNAQIEQLRAKQRNQ